MDPYLVKNPVDKGVQLGQEMSEHVANTLRSESADRGMNHIEGGWPKELNLLDEEAVIRYRKKLEREENYIEAMKNLSKPIEHAILQNNAINIYQQYFVDNTELADTQRTDARIKNRFRDPAEVKRPISHLSWSADCATFAATYCNMDFHKKKLIEDKASYIWDAEIPSNPQITLETKTPIVALEYNPRDKHSLVAGLYTGQVCYFDPRKAPDYVDCSPVEVSHRDPCHSVLWINSKTGMEFFSASSDGVVKWWDCRKLNETLDHIILDVTREGPNMMRAQGTSCLEYDPNIPAKYLVGTEAGCVICGNRKGTNYAEKLPWMIKSHSGPIYAVERNHAFSKCFLVVADWSARIWSEDCKESAIMWTNQHKARLTCGQWNPCRYSVFYLTRSDGILDIWDLLQEQRGPLLSVRMGHSPLTTLRVQEDGEFLVVGDENGTCSIVQFSEDLITSSKNDKFYLMAMFERESRREKILESRNREIRLRWATKMKEAEEREKAPKKLEEEGEEEVEEEVAAMPVNEEVVKYEMEYWAEIEKYYLDLEEKTRRHESIAGEGSEEDEEESVVEVVPETVSEETELKASSTDTTNPA
ncbi:UNVERIFIED_CONTAM: hypothetical protein PYX00_001767 [Menopon gallinae]|uniref:Dynein intermediate chain 3, ciliary n=1 Tax=Menopon gallinae TaxID=328185 RepID=A0AAW2IDU5_9NEOP